ncbi:MAG: hypothetical protein ACPGRZ_00270 [Alphaproteobacteria bacterium]
MRDDGGRTKGGSDGQIHWPTIADPMILLDELERRLDYCESTVGAHLEQIQRRLDALETDMSALKSDLVDSRRENERIVLALADRLTRVEHGGR